MIALDLLLAFTAFAFLASITPGPNNLMMASGGVFGFRRTLPHIVGVVTGLAVLLGGMVLGLGLLLERLPGITKTIQLLGTAWLGWLGIRLVWAAYKAVETPGNDQGQTAARPLTVQEAALFQFANPKALVMTTSCAGAFAQLSSSVAIRMTVMVVIFSFMGILTSLVWTLAGSTLSILLQSGRSARIAQAIMGLLFFATASGLLVMLAET